VEQLLSGAVFSRLGGVVGLCERSITPSSLITIGSLSNNPNSHWNDLTEYEKNLFFLFRVIEDQHLFSYSSLDKKSREKKEEL
jgi:hypothetical protein